MKLFVTDYDETLYLNDIQIKENILMLKKLQEKDFKIVISTGRSYPSIKNQISIYKIPYDYLSCADGSIIYDQKGNVLKMFNMNSDIIKPFQNFYQNLNYEEIQFSYPEGYLNYLKNTEQLLGINICISTRNYNQELVNSFLNLKNYFPNYNFLDYAHPNYSYLCVKPSNISKSYSIDYLSNYLKIKKEDIYVIGDSQNDYEMIKDFNGVGMINSCPSILNIVKKKYETVALYIKDILEE